MPDPSDHDRPGCPKCRRDGFFSLTLQWSKSTSVRRVVPATSEEAAVINEESHLEVTQHVSCFTRIGSPGPDGCAFASNILWSNLKISSDMTMFETDLDKGLDGVGEENVCTVEVNSGAFKDTTRRRDGCQQIAGDSSQGSGRQCGLLPFYEGEADADTTTERDLGLGIDQQREVFAFPEGEADVATTTERDMESLVQPMMYLSDNITDFFMMYLEGRLSAEDKLRCYFFSSFFFTKLLGINSASANIDPCEADYAQVRKWTQKVNLFEKDYIFIPVVRSAHWSLIIIINLSSLLSSPEKGNDSPCIFHLDSVEGKHGGVEHQVRSYLYQACWDKYQASNKKEEMLLAVLSRMKYVQAKVPQQDNGSDCGLYILQYVEAFLFEPPRFSLASSKWGAQFAREVSAKRMAIQKLILDRSRMSQEQAAESMHLPGMNQQLQMCVMNQAVSGGCIYNMQKYSSTMTVAENIHLRTSTEVFLESQQQPKELMIRKRSAPPTSPTSPPRKRTGVSGARALLLEQVNHNCKKWTDKETSELLVALVGGRFRRGKRGGMRWDDVNIEDAEGRRRTKDQCQNRYDVLSKAYKTMKEYAIETGKPFSEITAEVRRRLKLATPLRVDWYMELDKFHSHRRPDNAKSPKRAKFNPDAGVGPRLTSSSSDPASAVLTDSDAPHPSSCGTASQD